MRPFDPLFRNPHLLTLAGNFWRRAIDEARFPTRCVLYRTEPDTLICVEENSPLGRPLGHVLLHHGLEGSSRSGYLISLAAHLLESGYAVGRMNMRGCGAGDSLTPTLYHSGLTSDAAAILAQWRAAGRGPRFLAGFSLGGNVVLKLAGELGSAAGDLIAGVCAVSTPIDLHACVRRLALAENRIYEWRFMRGLRARYRRRHLADPLRYPIDGLDRTRTIFDFDDRFTAKAFGFGDAPNYYATQSATRFLSGIRVPTLLVQAQDDPLIPFEIYNSAEVRDNRSIRLLVTAHGGHLGFISRRRPRFWLDPTIAEWIEDVRNNRALSTV